MRTSADGRYEFDHLTAGKWSIRRCERDFSSSGEFTHRDVAGFDPTLAEFSIEIGRTTVFDLDLHDASCRVDGRLPPGLSRTSMWRVGLIPGGDDPPRPVSVPVEESGAFRVEASELGPHDLVLSDSGEDGRDQRIVARLDLARGVNEWSLALATGSLEGEAASGALLEHTWQGPSGATCTTHFLADAQGRFRVDGIPAGAGRIATVRPKTSTDPRSVDVPAGDVLHLSLR